MITLCNISKHYGDKTVLARISVNIGTNQTLAVVGQSGCGKTTLLRIIAGLTSPDEGGTLYLNANEMTARVAPHQRDIAMVFQDASLWNHMTVRQNICFGMIAPNANTVQALADAFDIAPLLNRYPHEISGGQAKRVALARALAADKRILLLDEPLSNLDADTKTLLLTYLKQHVCGKKTLVYVTHDPDEVAFLDCEVLTL